MMESAPEISIVIPVRHATETIGSTVKVLIEQCRGVAAEIILVVSSDDPTCSVARSLAAEPPVRLIEMPARRSVPQLRGEGLRQARGRLVAITEDHCLFSPGWVRGLIEAQEASGAAAVGGPVENGRTCSPVDWVIYFSRYAGSMPPVPRGFTSTLSGNNACYRRDVLESHAALFRDGFWENDFNRELLDRGKKLWLEPGLIVIHNKPYRFGPYLALRYRHARCFGGMLRARLRTAARLRRIFLSPLIPVLLLARSASAILAKRRRRRELFFSIPALLLCYLVWFWGELAGYLLGPGTTCSETD